LLILFIVLIIILVCFAWKEIFLSTLYAAYGLAHVRLVDELPNGSLVFRTGLPMESMFDYLWFDLAKLKAEFRRAKEDRDLHLGEAKRVASAKWTPEMESMPLVDISLLTREAYAIGVETQFFQGQDMPNEFIHLPMYGVRPHHFSHVCGDAHECKDRQPRDLNDTRRHEIAARFNHWDEDDTVERMQRVTEMVQNGPPRIYFFHCLCGCDRTGAFFIQYSMTRNASLSFIDLLHESIATSGRALYYQYQVSAQWYCEYLRTIGVYSRDDCGACDGKKFRCEGYRCTFRSTRV